MKLVIAAAIALCCAAIVACGAAARKSGAMPPTAPDAREQHASPRDEITRLDQEIADKMAAAKLPMPATAGCTGAACAQAMEAVPQPLALNDPKCHPAKSQACDTSCELSGSICKNADRICELAKGMADDDWAANKCKSARESCAKANESCCTCML